MPETIKLTRGWTLSDGIWDDLPLEHPVSIREALRADGRIPEIERGIDALHGEWVDAHRWTYSLRFDAPQNGDDRCILALDGLMGACEIALDGVCLTRADARAARVELTGLLRDKDNLLTLCFAPGARGFIGGASVITSRGLLFEKCELTLCPDLSVCARYTVNARESGDYEFFYQIAREGESAFEMCVTASLDARENALTHTIGGARLARARAYPLTVTVRRNGNDAARLNESLFLPAADVPARGFADCERADFHTLSGMNANAICPEYMSDSICRLAHAENMACLRDAAAARPPAAMQRPAMLAQISGGERCWPAPTMVWRLTDSDLSLLPALSGMSVSDAAIYSRYRQAAALSSSAHGARLRGEALWLSCRREEKPRYASCTLFDADGAARPAAGALRGAWRSRHVYALLPDAPAPGSALRIPVYYFSDADDNRVRLVVASAYDLNGHVMASRSFPVLRATSAPAGYLSATPPEDGSPWLMRVSLREDGEEIDRWDETANASAALSARKACLSVSVGAGGAVVRNDGPVAALGVSFGAAASGAFPGWGALLVGESLSFQRLIPDQAEGLNIIVN